MTFTNKTDSGLTVSMKQEFETMAAESIVQESALYIEGGFGKIALGGDDGAADAFNIDAQGLVAEEATPSVTSASIATNTEAGVEDGNDNKVLYTLPAMGGFTAGISFTDSGAVGSTDTTTIGANYTFSAAGADITFGGANSTTGVSGATDNDSHNLGIQIAAGDMTIIASQSEKTNQSDELSSSSLGISFAMPNGMTVGAYTFQSEDDLDTNEEYEKSGFELQYTIASGLTAYINIDDYEYTATSSDGGSGGSTTATSDSGSNTKLTQRGVLDVLE
jgi:hypothetical protein